MAVEYARVVFHEISSNIDLDGKIRTYSDIAKWAAIEHLGRSAAADVPVSALTLHGPVVAVSKESALAILNSVGGVEFSDEIDRSRVTNGVWFLLKVNFASIGTDRTLRRVVARTVYSTVLSHVASS
jgi:hypothetical protein